jgi:hypothetical protein
MSVPAGTKNSRAEGFLLAKHKPTNIPRLYFILTITWSLAYVVCKHRIDDRTSWTCFAGHFDGNDNAPVRCQAHQPMQHVQGYLRSHWTPPSGNYSSRIAPAVTMVIDFLP